MIVFLKNTLAQINAETRQGSAPVARVTQSPVPSDFRTRAPKGVPAPVDAFTGGTQPIARYFAAQMAPCPRDQEKPDPACSE